MRLSVEHLPIIAPSERDAAYSELMSRERNRALQSSLLSRIEIECLDAGVPADVVRRRDGETRLRHRRRLRRALKLQRHHSRLTSALAELTRAEEGR